MDNVAEAIAAECDGLKAMLLAKNAAYGNSALEPLRLFSRADVVEQLKVRIDDKLSRLVRGQDAGEDVVLDLLGYLVLLRVAGRKGRTAESAEAEEEGTEAQRHKGTEGKRDRGGAGWRQRCPKCGLIEWLAKRRTDTPIWCPACTERGEDWPMVVEFIGKKGDDDDTY